jgi:hypothetical protein
LAAKGINLHNDCCNGCAFSQVFGTAENSHLPDHGKCKQIEIDFAVSGTKNEILNSGNVERIEK